MSYDEGFDDGYLAAVNDALQAPSDETYKACPSGNQSLVLSLFPGIGLLDHAFELEGFTVVRGPDVLWGGDVRRFHPPAGVFGGFIGGPPCQPFSRLRHIVEANGYKPRHENLIPEFERAISEGQPVWFLMEEVADAPLPSVDGYTVHSIVINNRQVPSEPGDIMGPEQNRVRRFSFGTRDGRKLLPEVALVENPVWQAAVAGDQRGTPVKMAHHAGGAIRAKSTAGKASRTIGDMLALQGLPPDLLDECPFTDSGKRQAIGNGVPLPLGREMARSVRRALGLPLIQHANEPSQAD